MDIPRQTLKILNDLYPDARPGLMYGNAFELLIATILSAQTTDAQVNRATKPLFEDYPTAEKLAAISEDELCGYIRSVGFFRVKAKHVIETCRMLLEEFDGEVPRDIESLMRLPGVGRKTANVVASNAFGVPAIAVDTHVFRVSNRIGLVKADDVLAAEMQLMEALPRDTWSKAHHLLIYHGRRVCSARKPRCEECALNGFCVHHTNSL